LETVARSGSIANPAYETITLDQGITGWVARHGKPRFEPDVTEAEEYLGLFEGIKSEIAVPIQRSGKTIGVLNIENAKENALNENHLHLAEAFADLIAVAIENQELYDQLQSQQRAQVNAIEEISRSIVSSFERETILEGILESTVTLMGEANLGNIRLVDEVTGDLVVEAQHGEAVGKSHDRIPKGQGITGYVAEFGESLLVSDVNDVSSLPEGVEYVRFLADTRSELAVPMKKEDEVIGVLNIEHPRPNAFTEEDQHLVEAVAGLSVVALENARLHQELQAMHQELQDKRINEMKALNDLEGQLADLEINL
jgi:GAF domain-containing protein